MAAPLKDSLDYIPLDCNFFSDPKIKALKVDCSLTGMWVYVYLLVSIAKEKGYYVEWNRFTLLDIVDYFHIEKEEVEKYLSYMLEDSMLFDKELFDEKNILTSRSIQRRFQIAKKTVGANRSVNVKADYWLLSPTETSSYIQVYESGDELTTVKKKAAKSKHNKSKETLLTLDDTSEETIEADKVEKKLIPKKEKHPYAEAVELTDDEYEKLLKAHSKPFVDKCIEILNNYKLSNGKKYKSDYHAILNWVIDKVVKEHPQLNRQSPAQTEEEMFLNPWGDING